MNVTALRRWWPLAAVLGLLFVTSLAATRSEPQLDRFDPDPPAPGNGGFAPQGEIPPTPAGTTPPGVTEAAGGLPDWVGTAAIALLAVAGAIVVALVAWALIRDQVRRRERRAGKRGAGAAAPNTADELVAALDAGIEELSDSDRDPRRAVIACWVRLEQAAAAAGTPRHPGDSPTDLVGRLLAEQRVDAQVLAALLVVYREARYATRAVDDRMRVQARSALERLRSDLGAVVAT